VILWKTKNTTCSKIRQWMGCNWRREQEADKSNRYSSWGNQICWRYYQKTEEWNEGSWYKR